VRFTIGALGADYVTSPAFVGGLAGPSGGNILAVNTLSPTETDPPTTLTATFVDPTSGSPGTVDAKSFSVFVSDDNPSPSPRVIVRTFGADGTQLEEQGLFSERQILNFSVGRIARVEFYDNGADGHTIDDFSFGPVVSQQPDLAATSLTWDTAQGGVDFGYSVKDAALTQDTKAALYWASGTTFDTVLGGPVYDTTIEHPVGDYGPFYVPNSVLVASSPTHTPPPGASHLLLVVNPDKSVQESDSTNDQNNVQWLALPDFQMHTATTVDSKSVTVDYTISNADVPQALTFDVYRSDQSSVDSLSVLVDTQTIDPTSEAQDLQQGDHKVQLIQGTDLPPDPSKQYIVVVANPDGSVEEDPNSHNTAYFQTYLLGVVVHGFQPNVTTHLPFGGTIRWTSASVPGWETKMASALKNKDGYNYVIPFNWVVGSGLATPPGQTQLAAHALFDQIVAEADQLAGSHQGDVVDLHLIAHSRGSVVVTQALQVLQSTTDPALEGSWIKVTLLDPHPAVNHKSTGKKFYSVRFAWIGRAIDQFQEIAKDPSIVLPANIASVDVYYQQTSSSRFAVFSTEHYINLWGEGQYDGTIDNESNATIDWHNLSFVYDQSIGLIGHSEVYKWYEKYVVDLGKTLSS